MRTIPQISAEQAATKIKTGDRIIVGGFGMTGNPVHLLHALALTDRTNLTYIGNNVGEPGLGGGRLLRQGQIKKAIGSYFTSNREAVLAAQSGALEVELLPQGTLVEAIRAGGAGLGGFFTPTSVGTPLAEGRETRTIDGKDMVFIAPIKGDVSLVRAWRADAAATLKLLSVIRY
jgi:3-oxoacid CoA-transferase